MDHNRRGTLAIGLILILLGAWFLLVQLAPGVVGWVNIQLSWPLIVVGTGALFFIAALLAGAPDLAVPASVIAGIGGLLYWQNQTGNWASWAYVWTLIPGFVGVGVILSGLFSKQPAKGFREGLNVILVSLIMFALFASFLGGRNIFGPYWPVLLIILGLWLLFRPLGRSSGK